MANSNRHDALTALVAIATAAAAGLVMPAGWPGQPQIARIRPNPDEPPVEGVIYIGRGRVTVDAVEFGAGAGQAMREHSMQVPMEFYFSHEDEDLQDEAIDVALKGIGAAVSDDGNALNAIVETCEITDADVQSIGDEAMPPEVGALVNVIMTWTAARALA